MSFRGYLAILLGLCAATARSQVDVRGTVETYFLSSTDTRGFNHALSWAELRVRFNEEWRATGSVIVLPTAETYDELCLVYEAKNGSMVRFGRLRTSFGFSDWSELIYNGFNHRPLVRTLPLVDGLQLQRNDSGVEFTTQLGGTQVQFAVLDSSVTPFQLGPDQLQTGMARVTVPVGQALMSANYLRNFDLKDEVYGMDLRWTFPRLQVRAEGYVGAGGTNNRRGYHADFSYRVPKLERTNLIARAESMETAAGAFQLVTVGARQVIDERWILNLNYGVPEGKFPSTLGVAAPTNWSVYASYRVTF